MRNDTWLRRFGSYAGAQRLTSLGSSLAASCGFKGVGDCRGPMLARVGFAEKKSPQASSEGEELAIFVARGLGRWFCCG